MRHNFWGSLKAHLSVEVSIHFFLLEYVCDSRKYSFRPIEKLKDKELHNFRGSLKAHLIVEVSIDFFLLEYVCDRIKRKKREESQD